MAWYNLEKQNGGIYMNYMGFDIKREQEHVEVSKGGIFQFTADTVREAKDFIEELQEKSA